MASGSVIDYRCDQCGKLLRAPGDAAGRQARCPECGHIQEIPRSSAASPGNPFATQAPPPPPGGPINPYAATDYDTRITGYAVSRPIVPTQIDLGELLSRAWTIYRPNALPLAGITLFYAVFYFAVVFFFNGIQTAVHLAGANQAMQIAVSFGAPILNSLFNMWLGLGLAIYLLRTARASNPSFADLFRGAPYMIPMILAVIVVALIMATIALACFLPVLVAMAVLGTSSPVTIGLFVLGVAFLVPVLIYVSLMLFPLQMVIIDRGVGPIEALALSRDITRGNKLTLFALAVLLWLIGMLGFLAACVGVLFSWSFAMLVIAVAYLMMSGQPTADRLYAPAPIPT
jgi:phage FluMu protein Com